MLLAVRATRDGGLRDVRFAANSCGNSKKECAASEKSGVPRRWLLLKNALSAWVSVFQVTTLLPASVDEQHSSEGGRERLLYLRPTVISGNCHRHHALGPSFNILNHC